MLNHWATVISFIFLNLSSNVIYVFAIKGNYSRLIISGLMHNLDCNFLIMESWASLFFQESSAASTPRQIRLLALEVGSTPPNSSQR